MILDGRSPVALVGKRIQMHMVDPVKVNGVNALAVVGQLRSVNDTSMAIDGFMVPSELSSVLDLGALSSSWLRVPLEAFIPAGARELPPPLPLPPHVRCHFDEAMFAWLLEHSVSLGKADKLGVIRRIPQLTQFQADELMRTFLGELIELVDMERVDFKGVMDHRDQAGDEWRELCQRLEATTDGEAGHRERGMALCDELILRINSKFRDLILRLPGKKLPPFETYPAAIYSKLKDRVIGQDEALKKLAVVVFEHHLRGTTEFQNESVKPTLTLVAGPSGVGKTMVSRLIAEQLGLPFVHVNAPNLVPRGIVGEDLGDVLHRLRVKCNNDLSAAEKGVVFLDEFDKLIPDLQSQGGTGGNSWNRSGEVLSELLLGLEGDDVRVDLPSEKTNYYFKTSQLLFILGGAFDGIEGIVRKRLNLKSLGFGNGKPAGGGDLYQQLTKADFIAYGFSPQLMGRIPVVATLSHLGEADFLRILENEEISPLAAHQRFFEATGDVLRIPGDCLTLIASAATSLQKDYALGARVLNDLLSHLLAELKFATANGQGESVTLTKKYVEQGIADYRAGLGAVRSDAPGFEVG